MRLPALSLQHYRFTIVAILLLGVYGVTGYLSMPRQEDPVVEPKSCGILVIYPGASPEDVEELIVDPIEEKVNEVVEVEHISSVSRDGAASVVVEFADDADVDEALSHVREKLSEAEAQFPDGILKSEVMKHTTARVVAMQIAVTSERYSYPRLKHFAEQIKTALERIGEVKRVELEGDREEEIRVSVDPGRLAQVGISLLRIVEALKAENANIPSGKVVIDPKKFNVRVSGQFERIRDIRETIVGAKSGKPLYLKDVAEVRRALKESTYTTRFNGERTIFVTVTQKEGTNVLKFGEQVETVLERMRDKLPKDLDVDVVFHQPDQVRERLATFQSNLLIGIVLVGLLVFLFVGLRMSLIVMTAIPLSIVIAFGWMHSAGVALEQISIAALVIALGMLVDNAIVVTENVHRLLGAGKSRREATSEGAGQVGWAVTSATMTTIAAFIPLMLMTEETGEFIRSIPYTVSFALLASLLVAMTVTPLLCYRLLKGTDEGGQKPSEGRLVSAIRAFIARYYVRFLRKVLRKRAIVLCIAFAVFVGSLLLVPHLGVQFFPKAERSQLLIDVRMPEGTSFEATDGMTRFVEETLSREPSVLNFASNVGKGNPTIYYNMWRHSEAAHYAQILVNLKTDEADTLHPGALTAAEMIEKLRKQFSDVTDARIEMREFEQGPPIGAPVAIRISGDEVVVLRRLAEEVENTLFGIEGAVNVDNDLKAGAMEVQIRINKDKARMLGLPNHLIARTVRMAISGEVATTFRQEADILQPLSLPSPSEALDVVVQLPQSDGKTYGYAVFASKFDRIYLPSLSGAQIPLSQVAQVRFTGGTSRITHWDRERTATVRADLEGRLADEVLTDLKEALKDMHLPEGYAIEFGGETEKRDKPFKSLLRALIIAIIAIYGILVLQFNSFSQPLVILVSLPLAFIGAICALLITGNHLGFMAFVGGVSLAGVVVNDAIVLIDFANGLRRAGTPIADVVVEAGQIRFIPVILTTVTTIGGLLPLTLRGGTLWAPMGWTIIGGLALATVLTLVIVPVLYSLIARGPSLAAKDPLSP